VREISTLIQDPMKGIEQVCIDFDFAQAFQCVVAIDLLDGDVVIL
jgi:hypothetical protein